MGNMNSGNRTGRSRAPGAGRPVTQATIKDGAGLMLTHVFPEGTADLGHGRATIERIGNSRLIKIPQADGSEIRILVVSG